LKKIRLGLVGALVATFMIPMAAPASATCRPEKPSTCEAELPDPRELAPTLSCTVGVGPVSLNYCELIQP
jgi:hypothetical protein